MEGSLATAHAHYEKALAAAKKESGTLDVLDQILEKDGNPSPKEIPLGIQDILLEQIVGTRTEGRKNCFSGNFLPLMKTDTEFAGKWIALCQSHLNEGIHTPIKVYEYKNSYYVEEGNKRVSVSKYFDTYTISADVIRVLPLKDDTPEYQAYMEYIDFYNLTKISYLLFTKPGCYEKVQELAGKGPEETWTPEEQKEFHSIFIGFQKDYTNLMGVQSLRSVCEAFLSFITVFDYQSIVEADTAGLKESMAKYKKEFQRLLAPEVPPLETDPIEKKPNIIQTLVPKILTKQKFAFIYPKNPMASGWTLIHDTGRKHLEETFPGKLTTAVYKDTDLDNIHETLEQAVEDGNNVIFTTSPIFLKETLRFAVEHPEIKFLNCNPQMSYKNVRTYYARLYEVKFLLGAIAGSLTETDKIGYVADYPILSIVSDINAFTMGAKMVNPRAQVLLKWSKQQYDEQGHETTLEDIYGEFRENGISIICDRDTPAFDGSTKRIGLYLTENDEIRNLAAPTWNWNVFYEKTATNILNGIWKTEAQTDKGQGVRYWWGLSSGLVDILCSAKLPIGTIRLVELLKHYFINENYNPFSGRLFSQDREILSDPEASLTPAEILQMDWLVDGVIGTIPPQSSLNDAAKAVTTFAGVNSAPYVL